MYRTTTFFLLTLLFVQGVPLQGLGAPFPGEKMKETITGEEIDEGEKEDELDRAARNLSEGKVTEDLERPIDVSQYDNKREVHSRKTTYAAIELLGGPQGGTLDFQGTYGFRFDVNGLFKVAQHFGLALNVVFGGLWDSDAHYLQTLGTNLAARIYFPLKSPSKHQKNDPNTDALEGYIAARVGYLTQRFREESQKKLSGINMGIGLGVDWFLSAGFKITFQFAYDFPYWLESCDDSAGGGFHCANTDFAGQLWKLTAGVALLF